MKITNKSQYLYLTVNEKFNRTVLSEGRNYGLSFAFIKNNNKNTKDKFDTVTPLSACKDYLNDFIFSEIHKVYLTEIYGYQHEKLINFFDEKDSVQMVISVLPKQNYYFHAEDSYFSVSSNQSYIEYIKDVSKFINYYKNIPLIFNSFLEYYNITDKKCELLTIPTKGIYLNTFKTIPYKNLPCIVIDIPVELFQNYLLFNVVSSILRETYHCCSTWEEVIEEVNTVNGKLLQDRFDKIPNSDKTYWMEYFYFFNEFNKVDQYSMMTNLRPNEIEVLKNRKNVINANNIHNSGIIKIIDDYYYENGHKLNGISKDVFLDYCDYEYSITDYLTNKYATI